MTNQTNDLSSGKEILETSKQSGFRVLEALDGSPSCIMPPANHVELFSNLQRFAAVWMQKGRDESCELMTQVDKALMDSLHKTAEIYQKENAELRDKLAETQAKLDRVMLEHCPNDMSKEQLEEWANAQRLVPAKLEGSEWQPIETAPKDGTVVLGYDPSWYDMATPMNFDVERKKWMFFHITSEEMYASHWMPMPAAPKQGGRIDGVTSTKPLKVYKAANLADLSSYGKTKTKTKTKIKIKDKFGDW